MTVAAILFLKDPSQKLIRSSEIPREQLYQICMQSNQRLIRYRAHKLFLAAILENGRLQIGALQKIYPMICPISYVSSLDQPSCF